MMIWKMYLLLNMAILGLGIYVRFQGGKPGHIPASYVGDQLEFHIPYS